MILAVFSFHKNNLLSRLRGLQRGALLVLLKGLSFRQDGGAPLDELLPPSYQPQDPPRETLGGALRINIREIEQQGRGSITTHRPIR